MYNPDQVIKLSYEELECYTGKFDENNFIGDVQFGRAYRGELHCRGQEIKHIVVKIWDDKKCDTHPEYNDLRLIDETILSRHEKLICHPCMVTLYGYCHDGQHLAIAYDFKSMDTLNNLIPKDGFTWLQRIKVALRLAGLLKFLHTRKSEFEPFVVRNLDAAHILLEEDYNPKLIDFGMITGGIFPSRTAYRCQSIFGSRGYADPVSIAKGGWTVKSDIFAFGIILLSLISKSVYIDKERENHPPFPDIWACLQYDLKQRKRSLLDPSLAAEPVFCSADGPKITELAMDCVKVNREDRPTTNNVFETLLNLQVVKENVDFLNVEGILGGVKAE